MDSLWIINERDKNWKHSNFYHGNFVPQIPNHFIQRYTKKWWWVWDFFLGSWTTAIECEKLWRNIVWVDIQKDLVKYVDNLIISDEIKKYFIEWDSKNKKVFGEIKEFLEKNGNKKGLDLVLLHPPYFDIIKFSNKKDDLSNEKSIKDFFSSFWKVLENTNDILKEWWYMVIVIWDKYQDSEWKPLGFYAMHQAQKVWFNLKSIIIKNMEGNRWKFWVGWIWKYRALSSDYYIFKHEYILVFKK
jgi:DNA modification methylase